MHVIARIRTNSSIAADGRYRGTSSKSAAEATVRTFAPRATRSANTAGGTTPPPTT
ncbi:Uncharacterised protein [Mycobacteroides abscessus subsp. abscessus]|nr:Uncharacterised protein [Mycobacteroides abscessus subsp. abscessus]